mgnify:FL=1
MQVGSIIYLKREDICPADIVILDTSFIKNRENICYVDTKLVDGKTMHLKKKAAALTKRKSNAPPTIPLYKK